jgi:hypothetical protein
MFSLEVEQLLPGTVILKELTSDWQLRIVCADSYFASVMASEQK